MGNLESWDLSKFLNKDIRQQEMNNQGIGNDEIRSFFDCQKFYNSVEWKNLRDEFLEMKDEELYLPRCNYCKIRNDDSKLNVDHIQPIKYFWKNRLDINNLQLLCWGCNKNKGNRYLSCDSE